MKRTILEVNDINTRYSDLPAEELKVRRFYAVQTFKVRVSAKDAQAALNVAIHAGANSLESPDWEVRDRSLLQAKASGLALEKARRIAERMAQGLGARLGALVYASNEKPSVDRTYAFMAGGGGSALATIEVSAGNEEPLNLLPKKISETATVYAVFAIE